MTNIKTTYKIILYGKNKKVIEVRQVNGFNSATTEYHEGIYDSLVPMNKISEVKLFSVVDSIDWLADTIVLKDELKNLARLYMETTGNVVSLTSAKAMADAIYDGLVDNDDFKDEVNGYIYDNYSNPDLYN